jgi:NAD(P)-dependent dehydrogenase (short-subunit alcohol dehydrogenase family)
VVAGGRLSGKAAIITGAASGIGQACAELFAEQGACVLAADWNREGGERVAALIRDRGFEAAYCYADVSQAADVERMVRTAVERYGKLDALVSNAAVQVLATLTGTTEEAWQRMQSVNLQGVFLCSKYAIPEMVKSGGGSIVNMASALGLVGDPDLAAYGAFKGGVIAMTKAAAIGYGPQGIRVNCICPGDVNTPMVQDFFNKAPDPEAFRREVAGHYALRRIAEPREIAEVAAFLASDASSFITGSAIVADGGLTSKCY